MYKCPLMLLLFGLLSACGTVTNDPVRQSIPGKYVRKIQNEFSAGTDTLSISVLSEKGNSYKVEKRSSFKRLANGNRNVLEAKAETWTAVYNESERVLRETVKGKVLSFIPEKNILLVGKSEYQRITDHGHE